MKRIIAILLIVTACASPEKSLLSDYRKALAKAPEEMRYWFDTYYWHYKQNLGFGCEVAIDSARIKTVQIALLNRE